MKKNFVTLILLFSSLSSAKDTYNFQFQKAPQPIPAPSVNSAAKTETVFSPEPVEEENVSPNLTLPMEASAGSQDISKPHQMKVRLGFAQFENANTEYVGPAYHSGLNVGVEYKMSEFMGFEGNVLSGKAKTAVPRWKEDDIRTICCDENGNQYTLISGGNRYDDEVPNELNLYRA